uniref:Uncharacterized protein n=1 Tax=Nothobranchius rachovii TaxID=451742 RepID=A0A1A8S2U0_9TELE
MDEARQNLSCTVTPDVKFSNVLLSEYTQTPDAVRQPIKPLGTAVFVNGLPPAVGHRSTVANSFLEPHGLVRGTGVGKRAQAKMGRAWFCSAHSEVNTDVQRFSVILLFLCLYFSQGVKTPPITSRFEINNNFSATFHLNNSLEPTVSLSDNQVVLNPLVPNAFSLSSMLGAGHHSGMGAADTTSLCLISQMARFDLTPATRRSLSNSFSEPIGPTLPDLWTSAHRLFQHDSSDTVYLLSNRAFESLRTVCYAFPVSQTWHKFEQQKGGGEPPPTALRASFSHFQFTTISDHNKVASDKLQPNFEQVNLGSDPTIKPSASLEFQTGPSGKFKQVSLWVRNTRYKKLDNQVAYVPAPTDTSKLVSLWVRNTKFKTITEQINSDRILFH